MISKYDQAASPAAHTSAEAASSAQASRVRPLLRQAATAPAAAAIRAAPHSPKSSTASLTWTPSILNQIQATKASVSDAASAAAMAKLRLACRGTTGRADLMLASGLGLRECDDPVKPFLSARRSPIGNRAEQLLHGGASSRRSPLGADGLADVAHEA